MSSFRSWAFWRRVQYGTGFVSFVGLVTTGVYFLFFYNAATCFDNMQNGLEAGVDCDGSCVRICTVSVIPPEIKWAQSFKIVDGQYNAVAYVDNKNALAATPNLAYTFKLYDENDVVVAKRSGTTILPPNSVYPIFEGRVLTDGGVAAVRTTLELAPADMWVPSTLGRGQFKTLDVELLGTDSRPRLNASVENIELVSADRVEVVATVFNRAGQPLTASQTFVDNFAARSTEEVVFTWPNSIAKTVRSCEVPSDIILVVDRSGSMAADGGTPPEPLESAKLAAVSFVSMVRPTDLLGYLSYATEPSNPIEQILSANQAVIKDSISKTSMGTNGTQYTNMGAAIDAALAELVSSRHREEARKVIIFLTDGDVTRPLNPKTNLADREYAATYAKNMAEKAKAADVTMYTIGFGDMFSTVDAVERDVSLIRDLASMPENFYTAPTISELKSVYQEIANDLCEEGPTHIEVITKTNTGFAPLR
jgi:Mg-chelatase subunit ChlD